MDNVSGDRIYDYHYTNTKIQITTYGFADSVLALSIDSELTQFFGYLEEEQQELHILGPRSKDYI